MLKRLKDQLYILKIWKRSMFDCPPLRLERVDYDAYWEAKRGKDMGALSDWQQARADFVVAMLKGTKVESLCDIAAGEGAILHDVGRRLGVAKLIGTDISDVALERVRAFGLEATKLDIGCIDELDRIPAADYELLFEILEHVPHSELLLKTAYAKAAKGVFFSFPNTGFFVHRLRLFFGKFPMQWKLFPGEHVRYWTKRDLVWWLDELGFKNYTVHYYKGLAGLNKLCPAWFAAGFVVFIPKR